MKIIIARVLSLVFFLQLISPAAFAAQLNLQAPDIEPPAIKFDPGESSISDGVKTFSAEVTDNIGVANVTLYYKNADDVGYTPKRMRLTGINTYSADVTVDSVITSKIEFYIRADDVSGNSVFEGQKFSPFAYEVVPVALEEEVVTTVTAPPKDEEEEGMSTMTLILIGLGVAALAGGGGGGGGGGTTATTGSVTITTDLPD
jgi:hypothetical protein